MNSKLTKMFFVALTTSLTINAFAQTEQDRKKILADTNVDFLMQFSKEQADITEKNMVIAKQKAEELGMPVSGLTKDGSYFELVGLHENGELKYYRTFNNVANASSLTTAKAQYLHNANILGQNMIAGIWDGGIPMQNHVSLAGRVVVKDNGANLSPVGYAHATHVGGTIAASNVLPNVKGFLPSATLWANNFSQDVSEMASQAAQGLIFSNHSYGFDAENIGSVGVGFFGRYGSDARSYDVLANNAPYYTIVFAAGNDNGGSTPNPTKGGRDLLSQGGVSKNTIVVAAINGIQNYSGASSVTIAGFSSWGPTDDFRIKPDISAKGVSVLSLGVGGLADTEFNQGTSMAAPAVTGVVGLWQQKYKESFGVFMRSATVRALMAHTASEAGAAPGPDYKFGWGVINAEAGALVMEAKQADLATIDERTLENGTVYEVDFVYQALQPLVATIAWNDPAGTALNTGTDFNVKALVNDLDLRIINLDTNLEYLPWALVKSWTTSGAGIINKADNDVDNIEKIEITGAPSGNYRLRVSHKGTLAGGSQLYSLIMSGAGERLSVEENVLEKMVLYPNPVSDQLTVSLGDTALNDVDFEIFDMSGRKVQSMKNDASYSAASLNINVSGLSSGMYILKAKSGNAESTFKFVKK